MNGNDGASEFIHTLESPCDGAEVGAINNYDNSLTAWCVL